MGGRPARRFVPIFRYCLKGGQPASLAKGAREAGGTIGLLCRGIDQLSTAETGSRERQCASRRRSWRRHSDRYVIDCTSADGYVRKYRFIFVGESILPYHLAIGSDWKVHHLSTDMAHWPWMQEEEAAFLADPGAVFSASHYQALHTVRERIGLDYFGIYCGLDRTGDLVVFEVNASMLVHDDNTQFPYKDPFVRGIKNAFDAMLRKRACVPKPA